MLEQFHQEAESIIVIRLIDYFIYEMKLFTKEFQLQNLKPVI